MSTDMYGVRVLAVDPDQLRLTFRVFVVYYDTQGRTHVPLPNEEPGVFLHFLWESAAGYLNDRDERKGPIGHRISTHRITDFEWTDANARRYISEVRRVESLNNPPTDETWENLHDFYYARDGHWKDEDLLIQAVYEIRVTDRQWLAHLSPGQGWGSAIFPLNGDTWTAEDAPHIPDLANRAATLRPYEHTTGDVEYDHVRTVEFSDDGKYLAVSTDHGRVWIYDTADWSEVVHTHAGDWIVPLTMWVPGSHIITVKRYTRPDRDTGEEQWAYDVDRRAEVQVPYQQGHLSSRDGAYRISPNGAGEGGYDLHATDRSPHRRISHAGEWDPIQCKAFSGDSTRLFLGAQQNLYVVDPATGEVTDKVEDASERLFELAANPDGSYLAAASFTRKLSYIEYGEKRPHELCIWRMADRKVILGHQFRTYVDGLSWSPDGRWLVVVLEPTGDGNFHRGKTEIAVFPMGPDVNLAVAEGS